MPVPLPNAVLMLLLTVITATYWNHFSNGFHFDDLHTVVDNPAIRSPRNVRFFYRRERVSVLPANQTYRPIVSTSLALDYALGHGYRPLWFHLTTFALFLGLACLLYVPYRTLLNEARPSPTNRE